MPRQRNVVKRAPRQAGRVAARIASRTMSRAARDVALRAARGIARVIPGVGNAMTAYDAGRMAYDMMSSSKKKASRKQSKKQVKQTKAVAFTNVKSKGIFDGGKDNSGVFDKHVKSGVCQKFEFGRVKTETEHNVVYLGHSTAPPALLLQSAVGALVKKLFMLDSLSIKSYASFLTDDQTYDMKVVLHYKQRDGDTVTKVDFNIAANSKTLGGLVSDIITHLEGLADIPDQFLRLQLFNVYSGFTGAAPELRTSIDLTQLKCEFDMRSYLKIQNRTINSLDNDESDNVDNVPVQGKFFDFKSNGTVYQDYLTVASDTQLVSHPTWGTFLNNPPSLATVGATKMYAEIPLQSQFAGCKVSGSAHLDAGEIKTSVLKDSLSISFNKLVRMVLQKALIGSSKYTQVWLGKSRLFALERLLNAQVNNATRQYNFAYEHQYDIGCTVYAKRDFLTAPNIFSSYGS